ncbi:MAG TPA: hypothetical protein VGZ03_10415, partial [Acidimicrobiales bacterium]|nr:hypothetical protein [Acidimicrobiales bacterium]
MEWPVPAPVEGHGEPAQGLDHDDPVVVTPDFAAQADERFEAVCGELGILPARRVEPVAARVLPFGHEQVAMVQRLDAAAPLVAPGAVGVTPGRNALAAALPSAVAEGKVRAAVVFGDGDAPVRWGRADDEARLAALFAVVPHLGTFTATTGSDTYRVLRLPGIGVALVSEGASAATWVEGWFAALLHATQFALRTTPPSTDLVASPTADRTDAADAGETSARVLEQLEDECRRILTAAQDQAREIRVAAERDAARAKERSQEKRSQEERSHEGRRRVVGRERGADRTTRGEDPDDRRHLSDVRREIDELLGDAERARAALLADAQREADAARRQAELACAALVAETRTQCEALL